MAWDVRQTVADLDRLDYSLPNPRLLDLSDLTSQDRKLFAETWGRIETNVRRQIMEQLVELAEDNVEVNFDSIFRYGLQDNDATIRAKAIEGLWECQDASLIRPLAELLERDSSEEVQSAAATSLGNFAFLAELKKIRPSYVPAISRALLGAIGDPTKSAEVRCRALEATAPLSLPEVRDAIRQAYTSGDPTLKSCSLYSMGRSCDSSWLPVILREMSSPDATMRCGAAEAAGELGEEEATHCLSELVNDPDSSVALTAIQSLGKVGGKEAKKRLRELLGEPEELVRQSAREALDELEAEENPFSLGIEGDDSRQENQTP